MTTYNLSRRSLIAMSAAVSGSALADGSKTLSQLLAGASGKARVRSLLKKHFSLTEAHEDVIQSFYMSLLTSQHHTEDQSFAQNLMDNTTLDDRFEIYVIEEFTVSTNILAFQETSNHTLKFDIV
ncbi:MAG: hypothetical protein EOP04_07710 [Proteobacteria bacterium]|nr:MAG: hypothetical protein EOP04_07710 [Pseudomonadota bacterium]